MQVHCFFFVIFKLGNVWYSRKTTGWGHIQHSQLEGLVLSKLGDDLVPQSPNAQLWAVKTVNAAQQTRVRALPFGGQGVGMA